MVEVDPEDPAFEDPTKFVGPVYDAATATLLAAEHGWTVRPDGDAWRRVVPSPVPRRVFELDPITWLLERGAVVICAGGGGIPTMYQPGTRTLTGVEAVIDKDLASAVLARDIGADLLVIATDTRAVYVDWGTPARRAITRGAPEALQALGLPAGSMGPKVDAAATFVTGTGNRAVIGSLDELAGLIRGTRGTVVDTATDGLVTDPAPR